MSRTFVTSMAAVVFALALSAGQATAAQITRISYTVTGGLFSGPQSIGPISGGSLVYTAPAPYVSTPVYAGRGRSVSLFLTGPSGFFSIVFPSLPSSPIRVDLTASYAFFSGQALVGFQSGTKSYAAQRVGFDASYSLFDYDANVSDAGQLFVHDFTIGNEIRTLVPEPSIALLLGLGVLGLGLMASGLGAARSRRRTRRLAPWLIVLLAAVAPSTGSASGFLVDSGTPSSSINLAIFDNRQGTGSWQYVAQQFTLPQESRITQIEINAVRSRLATACFTGYLTDRIGLAADPATDLLAVLQFSVGTVQGWVPDDLDLVLPAGDYFLTVASPDAPGGGWFGAAPNPIGPTFAASDGNTTPNFGFPPATDFRLASPIGQGPLGLRVVGHVPEVPVSLMFLLALTRWGSLLRPSAQASRRSL